jgi:hypothetical protein
MNAKRSTALLFTALLCLAAFAAVADDQPPQMSPEAKLIGPIEDAKGWFKADPTYDHEPYDAEAQLAIYAGKHMNKTAEPPVQQGIRLYDRGAYTPRPTFLGEKNPVNFHFMAYGDLRVAGAAYDNASPATDQSAIAVRLNLDMDLAITATERIHAFVRPLDNGSSFTRYQISGPGEDEFFDEIDFKLDTLFFEGDINAMREGFTGRSTSFDLPIALGRVPLFTQNGIWLDDAFDGVAMGITARNIPKWDVSNTDVTVFAGFDKVTTNAAPGDNAKVLGVAGFADARKGYFEYGYGYVRADNDDQSYHNLTAAFSRRYRIGQIGIANSIRVIGNVGQSGPVKTADGVLLLLENSYLKRDPSFLVPYFNFFAGFDTPQPLARAAGGGGVLKNTGINFESDGMTAYPTLDASAHKTWGAAVGLEKLWGISQQVVFEAAFVQQTESGGPVPDQYALGVRFQRPLNNAWIFRADAMHGWVQSAPDVYGVRVELRRKF